MQSSQGSGSGRPATISFPELSARPRRPPSSPAWPGRLHSLSAQLVCPPCRGSGSVSDVCSDPGVSQRRFLRFPAAAPSARGLAAAVRQAVLGLTVLGLLHVTSVPGGAPVLSLPTAPPPDDPRSCPSHGILPQAWTPCPVQELGQRGTCHCPDSLPVTQGQHGGGRPPLLERGGVRTPAGGPCRDVHSRPWARSCRRASPALSVHLPSSCRRGGPAGEGEPLGSDTRLFASFSRFC